jgi:hypothetical protein
VRGDGGGTMPGAANASSLPMGIRYFGPVKRIYDDLGDSERAIETDFDFRQLVKLTLHREEHFGAVIDDSMIYLIIHFVFSNRMTEHTISGATNGSEEEFMTEKVPLESHGNEYREILSTLRRLTSCSELIAITLHSPGVCTAPIAVAI